MTTSSLGPGERAAPPRGTALVAIAAFVAIGLTDGAHGVTWPSLRASFGLPVGALALITLALTVGYIPASAISGRLTLRWATGGILWRACIGAEVALAIIALSPAAAVLLGGVVLLGAAGGAIDAGVQAHVTRRHGLRMMGGLHAAYGIGAAVSPVAVALMLAAGAGWRPVYGALAAVDCLLLVAVFALRAGWDAGAPPARHQTGLPGRDLLRPLAAFFVVTGLEAAAGAWLFTYLREDRGVAVVAAGAIVTLFGLAYTLPRLGLAAGGHRIAASTALRVSLVLAVIGFAVTLRTNIATTVLGLVIAGVGVGGMYPTLMSLTALRIRQERIASVVGYQVASATAGAAAGVGVPGVVFQAGGPGLYPLTMLVLAIVTATLALPRRTASAAARPAHG